MKRTYKIEVESGSNWDRKTFYVQAGTAESAMKSALKTANREIKWNHAWRVKTLEELVTPIIVA